MDDTERWLAQYKARIAAREQEAAVRRTDIAAASATVRSEDDSVTVTVGAHNVVRDLRLNSRAMTHDPARLAAMIMRTITAGQRAVTAKLIGVLEPTAGGEAVAKMLTEPLDNVEVPAAIPGAQTPANVFDELVADQPEPAPQPPRPSRPTPVSAPVGHPAHRVGANRVVRDDTEDFSEENPW